MECSTQWGLVQAANDFPGRQELLVLIGPHEAKAICYPRVYGVLPAWRSNIAEYDRS